MSGKRTDESPIQYDFHLTGYIVPYVRMTRRGKFVDERAQRYLASQAVLRLQFRESLGGRPMLPKGEPVCVTVYLWAEKLHTCDADNQLKAILDAMRGVVYSDDRWVDWASITRAKGKDRARVIVETGEA